MIDGQHVPVRERPEDPADRAISIEIASHLGNLALLRTMVAAAAAFDELDLDTVSDLKLAIDEACTRLIKSSIPQANLTVRLQFDSGLFTVTARTVCQSAADVFPADGFSWHVLNALVDVLETFEYQDPADSVDRIVGITMAVSTRTGAPAQSVRS